MHPDLLVIFMGRDERKEAGEEGKEGRRWERKWTKREGREEPPIFWPSLRQSRRCTIANLCHNDNCTLGK